MVERPKSELFSLRQRNKLSDEDFFDKKGKIVIQTIASTIPLTNKKATGVTAALNCVDKFIN
ncbi:MAG: hypothetical protein JNM44_09040 [Chitinophagaceae bacterium]|nr:hypothetical protein [Chitinophagaceae bacterium]